MKSEINWISCKERLPEDIDKYLVIIKDHDFFEDKWNYDIDVANSYGSYIDDFWDTINDWKEGQEVHITHWADFQEIADNLKIIKKENKYGIMDKKSKSERVSSHK